uniref:Phage integrase family protein n=1 Tax=Rhodopseudomonas palustris (strain BisA53) TaxID=316055 RepID=Q07NR7_RHOP5
MTPTPAIDSSTPKAWRNTTFSGMGNFSELAGKNWNELCSFEIFPGCHLNAPVLVLPEEWLPAGSTRRVSYRSLHPKNAGIPEDGDAAARRDEAIRRALLALWLPSMTQTGVRSLKPTTWIHFSKLLLKIARWQFDNLPSADGSVFGDLTVSVVLTRLFLDMGRTERARQNILWVIYKLIDAGKRGVISDWPVLYEKAAEAANFPLVEDVKRGAPEVQRAGPAEERNWKPFSDEFVSEFVSRGIWIIENLAEQSVGLWLQLRIVPDELDLSATHPTVIAERARCLAEFDWRDKHGNAINTLGFELHYLEGPSNTWPPTIMRDFNRFVSLIQAMTVALVAFCTAARQSELSGGKDTELQTMDDRFHSVTWKIVDATTGAERDWPLHPVAVRAIKVQQILSRALRPADTDHLWVVLLKAEKTGLPLRNLTEPLVKAVDFLGLSHLTGNDRAHLHRWRHTVARLITLSILSSPQVLLDLLGHADFDMTLTYMCSDPDIVELALKHAREHAYAVTGEAVEETIAGLTSGPAALPLQEGLRTMAMRRGDVEFATSSLRETVEVLTFEGRAWSMVRPGVICTKGLNQFGPCTRGRGAPDPATCRTTCDHRLELARAKRDCQESLDALIVERKHAMSEGETMVVPNLEGIILSHLARWDDVRENVLSSHPDLRTLWEMRS